MTSSSNARIGLTLALVTAIGWGLNWPVMKLLLREWPPLFARGTAGLIAAALLFALAAARREGLAVPPASWPRLAASAAVNVFAWMGFTTWSLRWLDAGEAALLAYTMPIWAALLAWPVRGERPTARSVGALALGVAGLVVLLSGQGASLDATKLPGVALTLGAAVLFAVGTVALNAPLGLAPIGAAAWQIGLGCVPMVALGLTFERSEIGALSLPGVAMMAYMTLIPMGVCYLSWFGALRRIPASTASMATLLTPVIGVVTSAWVLGEPLGLRQGLALALTLGGVSLALRRGAPATATAR